VQGPSFECAQQRGGYLQTQQKSSRHMGGARVCEGRRKGGGRG
jgi:hypothetical protein